MSTDKPQFPSDQADKFMLRLPDGMREQIRVAAEENNRSMNSEIVARLQQTFDSVVPTNPRDLKSTRFFSSHILHSYLEQADEMKAVAEVMRSIDPDRFRNALDKAKRKRELEENPRPDPRKAKRITRTRPEKGPE